MKEYEKLVGALVDFYKKISDGISPSEMLILRISQDYGLQKQVLVRNINKINRRLVAEKITDDWNLEEAIKEIIDPKKLKQERYQLAISKLKEIAPDITLFEIEKIGSELNLGFEQRKKIREEGEKIRRGIYQRKIKRNKPRPEEAKDKLRRLFLESPRNITKDKLQEIAKKHNTSPIILSEFYKENYKEWIEIREKCSTIEDLPN